MTVSTSHPHAVQKVILALGLILGTTDFASAEPVNSSGLSPQECYQKDSGCTQFCGNVTGDLRYECFSICDRMLDHCLDTGDWTDSLKVDPGTGSPPIRPAQLSAFLLRMMMALGDTNRDGVLSQKEIEAMKQRAFKGVEASEPKTPATPDKQ